MFMGFQTSEIFWLWVEKIDIKEPPYIRKLVHGRGSSLGRASSGPGYLHFHVDPQWGQTGGPMCTAMRRLIPGWARASTWSLAMLQKIISLKHSSFSIALRFPDALHTPLVSYFVFDVFIVSVSKTKRILDSSCLSCYSWPLFVLSLWMNHICSVTRRKEFLRI